MTKMGVASGAKAATARITKTGVAKGVVYGVARGVPKWNVKDAKQEKTRTKKGVDV